MKIVLLLSNFLNNEHVNIYVIWYGLYNFPLGGRDADIIDLNYKKGIRYFVYEPNHFW